MAQPQTQPHPTEELAARARRDVKRMASATKVAIRSLAQLEEGLRAHGFAGDIAVVAPEDNGNPEEH